eukprot:m.239516 g.239516  ORF g.239516 m.239516 type:complete len:571 (+) comp10919_c1_seq1:448-2160(+)
MSKAERRAYRERLRKEKEERRRQKELEKASETPEQKYARRLLKKKLKEEKRAKEKEEKMAAASGDKFVWHKRLQQAESKGKTRKQLEEEDRQRREANMLELERVRKQREQRELERQQAEEEEAFLRQQRENEQFQEWIKQDEEFQLTQAKLRSEIRIKEGRSKPIDVLAKYIHSDATDTDITFQEPYKAIVGLSLDDLEDLHEDIKVYIQMEAENQDYWEDLLIICENEIEQAQRDKLMANPRAQAAHRRAVDSGINEAVKDDIDNVLRGKSSTQLTTMQSEIERRIASGEVLDIGYWETLLRELRTYLAKARLRERHQKHLEIKLQALREKRGDGTADDLFNADGSLALPAAGEAKEDEAVEREEMRGRSPEPVSLEEIDAELDMVDAADDADQLARARSAVLQNITQGMSESDRLFNAELQRGMGDDEELFASEIAVDQSSVAWKDKYRPRKPRFFNRVHTGFEWNKYNQTHYDSDNPPPKIVQGYKFNIFYPDLIDKSKTPSYKITPLPDEPGFCIIRFHAGPPYEDIAFKIVHRKWEYGRNTGFRYQFNHNILQLWFRFRREIYRR